MTAQTQVQRNRSYRQRRAEKMARMEAALREIEALAGPFSYISVVARQALNPGKEMGA